MIPTQPLHDPIKIRTIDGDLIGSGIITLSTNSFMLQVSTLHFETISILVTLITNQPVILGLPQMQQHGSKISWQDKKKKRKVVQILFPGLFVFPQTHSCIHLSRISDVTVTTYIPGASGLPPHRSYDCAIELLQGTSPPLWRRQVGVSGQSDHPHLPSLDKRHHRKSWIWEIKLMGNPFRAPACFKEHMNILCHFVFLLLHFIVMTTDCLAHKT